MANRSVVVDLLVRTNQFTTGMRTASRTMASETTNMETKTKALQMQVGLLGLGMVAFAATAVSAWAKFDQAMARTEATGGEAAARIEELNEAAKSDAVIELGYNATEASDSIYELAKAGVSATDIIGGAMAGALSLAAAESMDAADAAAIMASALTQFNLTGDKSAHVADLIVAAAGKAQGSAHDLGLALKQSGLVADQFGLSIEETTGTLALFASAGLIGSDAGTSLRTMLLHLAGPSTKAAKLMDEIGLNVYKSNGEMVNMEELANNLQSSMGKLSEEQRNQALATIFGADATRAASLLYREGGDAVVEWTNKVNDAGYAQEVAQKRMDNLNGDIKKLSATWQRSMIEMGQSADQPLRDLVQGITGLIKWFGDLDPAIKGVILAITGGGGLAILAVLGISQIVAALGTLNAALVTSGVLAQGTGLKMARAFGKGAGVAGAVALATVAIAKLVSGLTDLADGGGESVKSVEETTKAILDLNKAASGSSVDDLFNFKTWSATGKGHVDDIHSITDALDALTGSGATRKMDLWASKLDGLFGTTIISSVSDSKTAFDNLDQSLTDLYSKDPTQAAAGLDKIWASVDQSKYSLDDLMALLPGYSAALQGTANDADIAAASQDNLGESTAAVTAEEVAAQKAHEEYVSAIVDSFTSFFGMNDVYQSVIDKNKEVATQAAESSKTTKDSWEDFYDGTSVSAQDYIAELTAQVEAQEAWAQNLLDLTSRVKDKMPADMQTAAQEMINELRGLGPEGAAQIQLLHDMSDTELQAVVELYNRQGIAAGEDWAAGVEAAEAPKVDADTTEAQKKFAGINESLDGLDGKTASVWVTADTSAATGKLTAFKSLLGTISGPQLSQFGPFATGYRPAVTGKATGGDVTGPGTGTSDSIHALLSNGEHVLTASDVQKAGGQDAVYRMRSAIQAGMLKFASGGAVGWGAAYMDYPDRLRLLAQIQGQQEDLGKTGDDAITGISREVLIVDLNENQKKLADAEYAASRGDKGYWDRLEKYGDQRDDYADDFRRNTFLPSASSSLSGATAAIDQARNNVLPALDAAKYGALYNALNAAEWAAIDLYGQLDKVDTKLEDATEHAKELEQISDGVKNGLVNGFSLDKIAQTASVNPFTGQITGGGAGGAGKGMLASAQAYAAKVKTFAQKLSALAAKGFSGVILQEIAAMGVDAGIPAADALLALDLADTNALNQAYADIATFGGAAGQAVTEGFYKGGVAAADGLVAGLTAQKDQVQAAINALALFMQNSLKEALDIHSPSRKFRNLMNFVGQGVVLGLDDQQGIVADASARLFNGVTVPGGGSIYGGAGGNLGSSGDIVASLSNEQVERLAVAFETGNVRNINASTAQKNRKMELTYGARGR